MKPLCEHHFTIHEWEPGGLHRCDKVANQFFLGKENKIMARCEDHHVTSWDSPVNVGRAYSSYEEALVASVMRE